MDVNDGDSITASIKVEAPSSVGYETAETDEIKSETPPRDDGLINAVSNGTNASTGHIVMSHRLMHQESGEEDNMLVVLANESMHATANDQLGPGDFNSHHSFSAHQLNRLLIESLSNGTASQAELLSRLLPSPVSCDLSPASFQSPNQLHHMSNAHTMLNSNQVTASRLSNHNSAADKDGYQEQQPQGDPSGGELIMSAIRFAIAARRRNCEQQHGTSGTGDPRASPTVMYNQIGDLMTGDTVGSHAMADDIGDNNSLLSATAPPCFGDKQRGDNEAVFGESDAYMRMANSESASGNLGDPMLFSPTNRLVRRAVGVTKEKKYVCDQCGKRFGYKHILQEHKNLHYGIKPYACPLCNKRFAAKSNLIQHRHRHIANEQMQQRQMQQQMAIKRKARDTKSQMGSDCSAEVEASCYKALAISEQAISTKAEGGPFEYPDQVPKRNYYADARSMPAYTCSQCSQCFGSERALRSHEVNAHQRSLRNSSVMSFRCVICGQTFLDGDDYAEHCRNVHPDTDVNPTRRPYVPRNIRKQSVESLDNNAPRCMPFEGLFRVKSEAAEAALNSQQWKSSVVRQPASQEQRKRANRLTDEMSPPSVDDEAQDRDAARCGSSDASTAESGLQIETRTAIAEQHARQCCGEDRVDAGMQADRLCSQMPGEDAVPSMDELLARFIVQGRLFKCRHCEIYFKERGLYSMHVVLHGDKNPWQCAICGRQMLDRNEFTLHFVNQQQHQNV